MKKGDDGLTDTYLRSRVETKSSGSDAHEVSLKTTGNKAGKVDKYFVKVGYGDWMRDPDDGDVDFLICISGASRMPKKGAFINKKKANDVDLRCEIDLKGYDLNAKIKNADSKDLKLVKCRDSDGKMAYGYLGSLEDAEKFKFALTSADTGEAVARLALKIDSIDASDAAIDF